MNILYACITIIVHDQSTACTLITVHACTMIIVHAFTIIMCHVSCPLGLIFDPRRAGGLGGARLPNKGDGLGKGTVNGFWAMIPSRGMVKVGLILGVWFLEDRIALHSGSVRRRSDF